MVQAEQQNVNDPKTPLVSHNVKEYSSISAKSVDLPRPGRSYGTRLKRRKNLLERRRKIVNVEFALAMTGLMLMLLVTELHFEDIYPIHSDVAFYIKLAISITTGILLLAVLAYHITDVKLKMTNKNIYDYRMVVTKTFVFKVSMELLVCAVHPLPANINVTFDTITGEQGIVPVDAVLSILMLLRFYIVIKFIIVHSHWMINIYMQSVGDLNKVDIDTCFILKSLIMNHPMLLTVSMMLTVLFINTWAMRACESYYVPDSDQNDLFNSMWLVTVTFQRGYGDLSPNSYCGRFIAAETGFMGVGITALLVTVVTSKFQQTRSERYLHAFMAESELQKRKEIAAADIIKLVLKVWLLHRRNKLTRQLSLLYRIKLNKTVQKLRGIDDEITSIIENNTDIIDVGINMITAGTALEKVQIPKDDFKEDEFEAHIKSINNQLNAIQSSLQQ